MQTTYFLLALLGGKALTLGYRQLVSAITAAILILVTCHLSASTPAPTPPPKTPLRLAVIAEGTLPETHALADLLTAALSTRSDIEAVERAAIDKVLAEHQLTADNIADSDTSIRLGQFLQANGLLFLSQRPTQKELHLRLAETHHGYIAGFHAFPALDSAQAAPLVAEICKMLPKLHLDLSQQTTVSILRFTRSLLPKQGALPSAEGQFEPTIFRLLMERLCQEPDIVVTERRRLGDVAREQQLTATTSALTGGTLLIDGEVATDRGVRSPQNDEAVVLTIRIRNTSIAKSEIVTVKGTRNQLADLIPTAVDNTLKALRQLRPEGATTMPQQLETRDLVAMARQHGIIWAGEAAYALNTNDETARDAYLKALLDVGDAYREAGATLRQPYLEMALAIARAEQITRDHQLDLWRIIKGRGSYELRRHLEHDITRSDPEIVALLLPFRKALFQCCEADALQQKTPLRKAYGFASVVEWSDALLPNPAERYHYRKSLLDRAANDSEWPPTIRNYLVGYLLTQHQWPKTVLMQYTASSNHVQRFYANHALLLLTFDQQRQRQYARTAIDALEALLQEPDAHGSHLLLPRQQPLERHNWLANALRNICQRQPHLKPEVHQKLTSRIAGLRPEKDKWPISLLQPAVAFTMPPTTPAATIPPPAPQKRVARFTRKTLLHNGNVTPAWHIGGAKKLDTTNSSINPGKHRYIFRFFGPQRLLVEGETLWIGLAGSSYSRSFADRSKNRIYYACGLADYHLPSRTLRSTRAAWLDIPWGNFQKDASLNKPTSTNYYYAPLKQLQQWHDSIIVTHYDAGVVVLPVNSPSTITDFSNAAIINTDAGLPGGQLTHCAPLESSIYLVVGKRYITSWSAETHQIAILYDSTQQITDLSMPEHTNFDVLAVLPDPKSRRVYFPGQIWKRVTATSAVSKKDDYGYLSYEPATAKLTYEQNPPAIDDNHDKLLKEARQALEADGIEGIVDVALWQGDIIAIVGYDENWRLEIFTEKQK